MPTSYINTILLSGQVGWVAMKYKKDQSPYLNFTVKQQELIYEFDKVIDSTWLNYFVVCFDLGMLKGKALKEGLEVIVEGRLKPYMLNGTARLNVIADKIVIFGNVGKEEQIQI